MGSRIPGFYRLGPEDRVRALVDGGFLVEETTWWQADLGLEEADAMIENVVGIFGLPNGVAVNFQVDGVDRVVPMVVEEPSVVAAVSNVARLVRDSGGFTTDTDPSVMIGQIQLVDVKDVARCLGILETHAAELQALANEVHPRLCERGGGVTGLALRHVVYDEPGFPVEQMVVLHVHLDCVDAMGANMINTIAERLAPRIEALTGETVGLKILSNLADRRLARARCAIPAANLGTDGMDGREVAERIASAWRFAWADPYRAVTHNKGVMNGIDAVALATGNDWRAIEAGAHAWCCRDGRYKPMTTWRVDEEGTLHGSIEVPMQFGTVGGPIRLHPRVRHNLEMLGVSTSRELAGIAVAVGLAQNLGALKALATEGIQAGHMRMHARSVAASAGARGEDVGRIAARLMELQDFSIDTAARLLEDGA